MDTNHQLIVRIRSFLNSTELLDSPTAQELYNSYKELNNSAAQRLVECEVLLQRKQKIEAVVLVQQDPNLFDLIDQLFFPERADWLTMAELYDWVMPDEINEESVKSLKKAVSEMDDLRPLLTEFRRIARTDQVKNKLHLLREISRIDKENPEWKQPLMEVENQYLSQLISEAQQAIQTQNFKRIEQISDELKNSSWVVTVPTVVQQKVEKIAVQHRQKVAKEEALVILERVSSAYASFDITALEDALLCWQEHCQKYDYVPDENENKQILDADRYLKEEKEKLKSQQEFQKLLARVSSLMDAAQPLDQVEMFFSRAQATGYDIPSYLSNRVEKYRSDAERTQKTATLLRGLKIVGIAAGILFVIGLAVNFAVRIYQENEQAKTLLARIEEKDLAGAKAFLADMKKNYPGLVSSAKIVNAKVKLMDLEAEEAERIKKYQSLKTEIATMLKKDPPDRNIREKLASLKQYQRGENEERESRDLEYAINSRLLTWTNKVSESFYEKKIQFEEKRSALNRFISEKKYEKAVKSLDEMKAALDEIAKHRDWLDKELLTEYKRLQDEYNALFDSIASEREKLKSFAAMKKSLLEAGDLSTLEGAIRRFAAAQSKNSASGRSRLAFSCLDQIAYFRAIFNFQNHNNAIIPTQYAKRAFFADMNSEKVRNETLKYAREILISNITKLQKNANSRRILSLVRVQTETGEQDLYLQQLTIGSISNGEKGVKISAVREDGTKIEMQGQSKKFTLKVGTEMYEDCQIIIPKYLDAKAIRRSRAPHQEYISGLFELISSIKKAPCLEIMRGGIQSLKEIQQNNRCAPYWKMILSEKIAEAVEQIDLSPDRELQQFRKELAELQKLNTASGSSLNNKFLTDSISNFFKHYDFTKLDSNLKKNELLYCFYEKKQNCKIQYLGFTMHEDGKREYVITPRLKDVSAEVYCFDPNVSGFHLVGHYDKNGLIIDEPYRNKVNFHLLFISDPADGFTKLYEELISDTSGLDLQKIQWPAFWPENRKGYLK